MDKSFELEFGSVRRKMSSDMDLVRSIESILGVSFGEAVTDQVVVIVTTSFALVVGLLVLLWKRSADQSKESKPVVVPKSVLVEPEEAEVEVDGKMKLTVFYGTQTGTAEGFSKIFLNWSGDNYNGFLEEQQDGSAMGYCQLG